MLGYRVTRPAQNETRIVFFSQNNGLFYKIVVRNWENKKRFLLYFMFTRGSQKKRIMHDEMQTPTKKLKTKEYLVVSCCVSVYLDLLGSLSVCVCIHVYNYCCYMYS